MDQVIQVAVQEAAIAAAVEDEHTAVVVVINLDGASMEGML